MTQNFGSERTGRSLPCNVCGKIYTDNIDKNAIEITCPHCAMKGAPIRKTGKSNGNKTINLKEKNVMATKTGRVKPADFTSSFKKYVNGVEEIITINQYKTWKEMVKESLGIAVFEANKHASMYLVFKKYLNKDNDVNLYLEKIGEDSAEVTRTPATEPVTEPVVTEPVVTEPVVTEPVVTEPVVTEPVVTEPEVIEPEVIEPEANDSEVTGGGTEPEVIEQDENTEPEAILTESDVDENINGSEIGGDTGIDADK